MTTVRIVLYLLLIVGLQGALTRVLPSVLSPPDLFLLTGVALALRLRPFPALLAGYALGLLQDVLGHGLLGLHAAGLGAGVLAVLGLRRLVAGAGLLQTIVTVTAAVAGQWLAFLVLTYWLRSNLVTVNVLSTVLPSVLALSLLCAPLLLRLAGWAFGRGETPEEAFA